jgi:hypothetical protein
MSALTKKKELKVWRGFHDPELPQLLKLAWENEDLVILLPPSMKDFSFLSLFYQWNISWCGTWTDEAKEDAIRFSKQNTVIRTEELEELEKHAVLGIFTSGTQSGRPRLIFYSKKNIQHSLEGIRSLFNTDRLKDIFVYPQPTHTFGLVLGYLHAVLNNLKINFSPGPYTKLAHEHWLKNVDEGTLTLGTPVHLTDLIQYVGKNAITPPRSYSAIIGGALVTKDLWTKLQRQLNIEFPSVGYGATEASPGVTHLPPGVKPGEDGDIGYALPGVEVRPSSEGCFFKGPNACLAIYENNVLNQGLAEVLLHDYLLSRKDEGGKKRFFYGGRTDLVINRGGQKISLENVEAFLGQHLQSAVLAFGIFDTRLGEDLALLISSNETPKEAQGKEEIRIRVQRLLQEEFNLKIPQQNLLLTTVPMTSNGKPDRVEALRLFLQKQNLQFPINVEKIKAFLPHRGSAIWVDTILETKNRYGVGEVVIDFSKSYSDVKGVRETACIEWVAQTYGYTVIANDLTHIAPMAKVTTTFIAEVKRAVFSFASTPLQQGDVLKIKAQCSHDFGALKIVHGEVFHGDKLLASVDITLYSA